MIPINPEAIGDPNQTPRVYIGEEAGKALGIRDSSPPSPAQRPDGQTVDEEAVRRRYAEYKVAWTDRAVDHAMAAACAADAADGIPALLADLDAAREALRRAEQERDYAGRASTAIAQRCTAAEAERERDSLARRCAVRFEETEKLRTEMGWMRPVVEAARAYIRTPSMDLSKPHPAPREAHALIEAVHAYEDAAETQEEK